MGMRYTPDELLQLRESSLSKKKPSNLPPAEEWMGPPQDNARNQGKILHQDRIKNHDSTLVEQTNRRPTIERHISRGSANPEDIILGPPKTAFVSATLRNSYKVADLPERPPLPRDADSRDRFGFRKGADLEHDRLREGRDSRGTALRSKRGDGDQDSDGWSTVKPRKSFGTEGAERFNGRMGGERHRDEKRFRDRDERDVKERPARGFDNFTRDNNGDQEQDGARRNGMGRGRNEPSWFKDNNDGPLAAGDRKSNGDKFSDRNRGWREKDRDERVGDRPEKGNDRGDRRWDRDNDRRQERDPEWMDEPADEKNQAHTQEDFEKWKQRMNAGNGNTPAKEIPPKDLGGQSSFFGLEKAKVETPLPMIEAGPDKFFGKYAKQDAEAEATVNSKKEGIAKANTVGKASRFTSFFSQEETQRRQTEPPPMPSIPPQFNNGQVDKEREKEDFQKILQKLTLGLPSSTPPTTASSHPPPPQERQASAPPLQEPFQQYRPERQEPPRSNGRDSQPSLQELLSQRQNAASQPSARSEQILQELVNQRQNTLSQSSGRVDQGPNRNAEFLMSLMQNARAAPEPLRSEQVMMRQPHQLDRPLPQMSDREQDIQREQRERTASQRQRRPDPPPGFYDDALFQRGPPLPHDGPTNPRSQAPSQPTQILQRPPPGLDQLPPGWGAPNTQLPPPISQQRHIAPPPGLAGGPARGMPMPQSMFPPGYPMGGFAPHPEGMVGAPRNLPPPPPGFMMPPPGFMGGPPMSGFQGPEGMAFGGPFDGRGAAPQGNFRRQ